MFNAHNITVSFGGETLFDSLSFRLGKGDRVGLIGKNGAGTELEDLHEVFRNETVSRIAIMSKADF